MSRNQTTARLRDAIADALAGLTNRQLRALLRFMRVLAQVNRGG